MGIDLWKFGMNMRNPGMFRSNSFLNPLQNSFSVMNVRLSSLKPAGKKPDGRSDKRLDQRTDKSPDERAEIRLEKKSDRKPDTGAADEHYENQLEEKAEELETKEAGKERRAPVTLERKPAIDFQEAVVWAEILGDPVSRKRRKKRMGQLYGDQGYAGRR